MTPAVDPLAPPPNGAAPEQAPVPPIWLLPTLVVGFLVGVVLIHGILLYAALSDPAMRVEDDYYARGLAWDAEVARREHEAELGWHVEVRTGPAGARCPVEVVLTDRAGQALEGAQVRLTGFHLAHPGRVLSAELGASPRAELPLEPAGRWRFTVEVQRGDERISPRVELVVRD